MNEFNSDVFSPESTVPGRNETTTYRMVALRGLVIFPTQTVHFEVGRDKSLEAIERANLAREDIFLAAQLDAKVNNPGEDDVSRVGVLARIQQVIKLPNDTARVLVTATRRMEIESFVSTSPCFEVTLRPFAVEPSPERDLIAIRHAIKDQLEQFFKVDTRVPKESKAAFFSDDTEKIVAAAGSFLFDGDAKKLELLSCPSEYAALEMIYERLVTLCDILLAEKRISMRVRESVDKSHKEYYLREQIKAIHSELGDDEDEIEAFRAKAKEKALPEYAMAQLEKELNRMSKMSSTSPEAGVIRTYLEWMLDLPWTETTADPIDLDRAEKILDEDHYGLKKVKERIIEYLAVHRLSGNLKGAILCFVGPPGVGKTSIVSSIARAAGRKLVQMSLGGVRDEAEIRGHRRTYIGAMPGRILSGMRTAGVRNPVFLLDEIDKMSSDFRGDPASAMLEVLDPNQNNQFKDHYLEIPYDLSDTMFVCTANTLDTIPSPLLDRMEVIELTGYTYAEKLEIAKRYLFPKQLAANGMSEGSVTITDGALDKIAAQYTRESGVRNLEREIATLIRKLAVKVVKGERSSFDVTENDLAELLGPARYGEEKNARPDGVGRVTGLAWTRVGGVTLDVEVALIEGGKGEITLTGNMGDVMKESARIAFSLVRSRARKYDIPVEKFTQYDIHINIPEGATPKDGPSAGITLATAILSALSSRAVRGDVAMTGEITLLGGVLAIGGLKEKSLAALRGGVKTLIVPRENEKDLSDIPDEVKRAVKIKLVSTIDEVFDEVLV